MTEEQKENIKKWIDALRSGKYQQGRKALRREGDGDEYCCLGVACAIYVEETGDGVWTRSFATCKFILELTYEVPEEAYLPLAVQGFFGLDHHDPRIGGVVTLTSLNDSGKHTFEEIADIIEREFMK